MPTQIRKRRLGIERLAEVVPLNKLATFAPQEVELVASFDTFGNQIQVQRLSNAYNHSCERSIFFIVSSTIYH